MREAAGDVEALARRCQLQAAADRHVLPDSHAAPRAECRADPDRGVRRQRRVLGVHLEHGRRRVARRGQLRTAAHDGEPAALPDLGCAGRCGLLGRWRLDAFRLRASGRGLRRLRAGWLGAARLGLGPARLRLGRGPGCGRGRRGLRCRLGLRAARLLARRLGDERPGGHGHRDRHCRGDEGAPESGSCAGHRVSRVPSHHMTPTAVHACSMARSTSLPAP